MVTGIAITLAVLALIISMGNSRLYQKLGDDVRKLGESEEKRMKIILDAVNKTLRERNNSLQ